MLRSFQARKQACQPFICWNCVARFHLGHPDSGFYKKGWRRQRSHYLGFQRHTLSPGTLLKRRDRYFNAAPISNATAKTHSFTHEVTPLDKLSLTPDIRQVLREWESDNASSFIAPSESPDTASPGDIRNSFVGSWDGDLRVDPDVDERIDYGYMQLFDRNELLDVGNRRGFLLPGDLVELRFVGGQQQELAIFVRELETQCQFYTMSGRWLHRMSRSAHFFVPHFVEPGELDELRPFLPETDVLDELRDKLHNFPQFLPRDLGKPLVRKMLDFWADSDAAYQATAFRLDNSHEHVAHSDRFTYATLDQIAQKILPPTISRPADEKFPNAVLYAVHRSLLRDDIGFRVQTKGTHRTGGQYEISPLKEVQSVKRVCHWVRERREDEISKRCADQQSRSSELCRFVTKARSLIDLSRETRQFTTYGTIGPSLMEWRDGNHLRSGQQGMEFDLVDKEFISFIESWAAWESFGLQSSLNGIGSEILRALKRYEEIDLGKSTAWTFLQEIGVIAPWENHVSFELRLPSIGRILQLENGEVTLDPPRDELQHLRKDWGNLPVYCIDDPDAHEIDDGISVEATEIPDEYWVHVHTADPAAHIEPESAAAIYAESAIENIYMPERVITMIESKFVQAHLSLAPNRPCMTFSARVNMNGDLLDTKITAGIVREVLFLSPTVMKEVIMGPMWSKTKETVRVVGLDLPESPSSRPMMESHHFSDASQDNLRLLNKIGQARAARLRSRGGIDGAPPRCKVSVSFNGEPWKIPKSIDYSVHYHGDPTIRISTEDVAVGSKALPLTQGNTVQSLMILAGEVAARWCHDRGIPIVYRVTPRNPDKENPSEFFLRKVLPSRDDNGIAPADTIVEYLHLLGGVVPSTTPGPHVAIGVDMMARCTSPLRRFSDLLLHWQVRAALLEEARSGKSLIGNIKEDFFPFKKAQIDEFLPRLNTREKLISYANRDSVRHWLCHFLVRAWLFKEAEIPSTFPFLVRSVNAEKRQLNGVLTTFLSEAQCDAPDWIHLEDLHVGDNLEVELEDVNVYGRRIKVKALRRFEIPGAA